MIRDMEYFKGTKGKWHRSGTVVVSSDNMIEIADVWGANELPHHEWTDAQMQEAEANAQVMAAAPDLLDAAASAWIMLNDIPEEFMDDFNKRVVNKLNQSISKALGYEIGKNKTL